MPGKKKRGLFSKCIVQVCTVRDQNQTTEFLQELCPSQQVMEDCNCGVNMDNLQDKLVHGTVDYITEITGHTYVPCEGWPG